MINSPLKGDFMNKDIRIPIIAGNWKMNKTPTQAVEFISELISVLPLLNENCEVVICPPFTALSAVSTALNGSEVKLGAQNCHFEQNGAFTGEISAEMLKELGCTYVIIGHSERRAYFAETDDTVNKRLLTAIQNGLTVILCVGENLEQRENGVTIPFINKQLEVALAGVTEQNLAQLVIAYEPIWAIGTGKTATPEQAQEVCSSIRTFALGLYGEMANNIRILYGGSMNEKNAGELLAQPDIDGGLIGGAALKADSFTAIVNATL